MQVSILSNFRRLKKVLYILQYISLIFKLIYTTMNTLVYFLILICVSSTFEKPIRFMEKIADRFTSRVQQSMAYAKSDLNWVCGQRCIQQQKLLEVLKETRLRKYGRISILEEMNYFLNVVKVYHE